VPQNTLSKCIFACAKLLGKRISLGTPCADDGRTSVLSAYSPCGGEPSNLSSIERTANIARPFTIVNEAKFPLPTGHLYAYKLRNRKPEFPPARFFPGFARRRIQWILTDLDEESSATNAAGREGTRGVSWYLRTQARQQRWQSSCGGPCGSPLCMANGARLAPGLFRWQAHVSYSDV